MKLKEVKKLKDWYTTHQRDLPWRKDQDPYKVWISETMLQQTTSQAVISYFHRFLKRFPNLKTLAQGSIEDIYEVWAGLGYYSRARNLHKAAQLLYKDGGFNSQSYKVLLEYPGFGPYTARSVASIAFDEPVGVLDGNVIRVLTRFYNLNIAWWTSLGRKQLQELSDQCVQNFSSRTINQAMMELGATLCTPKNPKCLICPVASQCMALKHQSFDQLPLKKPKKQNKIVLWKAHVYKKNNQLALSENQLSPFLKGRLLPPHEIEYLSKKPESFDFQHSITHYKIYVKVIKLSKRPQNCQLYNLDELKKVNPSSLIQKVLKNFGS